MNDAFHGQGGFYQLDPVTGKRVLVERTDAPTPAENTDEQPSKVRKKHGTTQS